MRNDTLFDSQNAAYAQAMFEEYARNPDSVPPEWRQLFKDGGSRALAEGLIAPEQLDGHRARAATATPRVAPPPPPARAPAGAAPIPASTTTQTPPVPS